MPSWQPATRYSNRRYKLLQVIFFLGLGLLNSAFASAYLGHPSSQQLNYKRFLPSDYRNELLEYKLLTNTAERLPLQTSLFRVQPNKKPNIFLKKEEKKPSPPPLHPRKKLLEETPLHTQKAWLYAAIVPGLGQIYNKSYWQIPVIYGVFGLLAWGAIYNHGEYITTKRELLEKMEKDNKRETSYPNLKNYMDSRKRDRTIFVASMFVWYLLNVFEAYVGGTLQTFDVSDDLEIVIEPHDKSSSVQNTGIGFSISLQSKKQHEDRSHWVW